MVSPETLRRYAFFAKLGDTQLEAISLISHEQNIVPGTTLFEEGQPATKLFVLLQGSVDLYFRMHGNPKQRVLVGEISAGMPFGISALIAPHTYMMTARAGMPARVIVLDGALLRALMALDPGMGYALMREIAKASSERLHLAQIQLARELEPDPVI